MHKAQPSNRLRELREAKGEKRWQVSSLVERDSTTVWRWEIGDTPIPVDAQRTLARHYGVTLDHLMAFDPDLPEAA